MATFKPTSMAGKTTGAKKNTFTPTKYAGYNQSTLYGWQRQNQSALDLINKYNTRVQNGEWLSVEDRAGYKSAIDSYTSSGTELRKASKFYGETGSIGDERRWYDSLSSLNEGYTGINDFYNQFKNDREYGVWKADADKRTEFEGLKNSNDYDYYVNIGKNSQANNIWNDIKKVADANHYSIGEFISDIKDGDWEALGGRALEQIISKFFPNSTIVNPVEVGSAFLDIRDFAKKWTTDKATMEEYLTPQEMDNYYYLIGKGDYEKANDYAKYYSNIARKEKGEAQVPNINNNIKELATAFKSGLDSFSTGFDQTLSVLGSVLYDKDVNVYNPTTAQYAYGKAREDNTGLWMMATDAAQSIGNQVPNYALAFATGGASGFIPMAISAGGNSYAEMINEGYGEGSAIAKGVATGALEALLGKWLGGLPGLGSSGGVFKGLQQKFLPQMSNTVARFLINNGVNMADEALEEGLQELLDPVVKWAVTLGEAELEKVNWEEVGYSALLGGLTAGVLEGVPSAIGTANTSIKTQQAFGNQAPFIVAETLAVDPTNKIALNAQNKLANNKTVSGGNLNEMLTTTDRARVKEAITNQLTEYGETSDISALAEALTKQTMGEELSKKESKLIESSKYGNRITNELNPNNIKSGQYTSEWAESIGTRRLNADAYSRRPSTKVKTKDGAENTINNVRSVAEGVATVELADGKVAKVGLDKGITSDVVFNDPKAENLFRIATDRVGKVDGWTTETANAMIKGYDGTTSDVDYRKAYTMAFDMGKEGVETSQVVSLANKSGVKGATLLGAYDMGRQATEKTLTNTAQSGKIESEVKTDESTNTYLRNGSEWNGSANPEGQVFGLEESTGRDTSREDAGRKVADSEAVKLVNEGRKVRVADLGILNGSKTQTVTVVDKSQETAEMTKAREKAESRGVKVRFFLGDNLVIEENGELISARAYIKGDYVFVRADHPLYTADQLMSHEMGHDMVAKGEVDINKVRERLAEIVGKENIDLVADMYELAYRGSNLSADEIWEECVCDSLGNMNVFSGKAEIDQGIMTMVLGDIKKATEDTKTAPNKTSGAPEQKNTAQGGISKASIDTDFYSILEKWDKKTTGFSFVVGETSLALQKAGIPQKQIRWDASKIVKLLSKHGGMTIDTIKQVPHLLENPIIVVDSKQGSNSKIVMGDLYDANGKIVTAVLLLTPTSRKGNVLDLIKLSSVEGRGHIKSLFTYEDGTNVPIRYVDKKRIQSWLNANRLQLPLHNLDLDSNNSIPQNSDLSTQKSKKVVKTSRELDSLGNELTKEQAEFFKDSKVRDAEGNLLVMYHGTNADFTIFDTKKSNQSNWLGEGSYFTSIEEEASFYGNNVVKAYLNITNPYIPTADKILEDGTVEFAPSFKDDLKNRFAELKNTDEISTSQITEILTNEGYDGILMGDVAVIFDSNQAKLTTNKAPTSNSDIRYSRELDIDYTTAVEQGDMATAQRMVDEAAKKAGYDYHLYHGTDADFTKFDLRKHGGENGKGEGYGIYLAANREISAPYGKNVIDSYTKFNRLAEGREKTLSYNEVKKLIKRSCELEAKQMVDDEEYDSISDALKDTWVSNVVYTYGYSNIEQVYNDVTNKLWQENDNDGDLINEMMALSGANYDYKNALNFYETVLTPTTGIDGFHYIWGNKDGSGEQNDIYLAFNSEQVKSADPVTYDDEGNVIPLSQRFNAENEDIRYSRDLETEGDVAIEVTPVSNRSLLANALLDIVQSDIEYKKLDDYKAVISYLEAEEVKLADLKRKIYDATFGDGDKSKLKELREEARKTEARIDLHDKKLLQLESTTALKNVLERAKKQAYSKALEKGREAMHRNVEGRRTSEIRNKIRKYKDNLIKTIEHPTERKYIPIDLVQSMIDVVDLIDTDTDLYKKNGEINKAQEKRNATKERLQKLRSEYENLKTNKDPLYAGEFDEAIYDYIKELQDNYSDKSINEMSLIELTEMYEILQAINETLLDARKLIGWTEGTTVIEAGDTIVAEQDEIRKARKEGKRNTAAKAKDAVIDLSLSPVRNVERMSGYNDDSPLVKLFYGFVEGVRKKNFFVMTSYRMFEKLTTGENQTVFEDARYKEFGEEMTDSQGRKFKVSKMQMMQAILSYERETANNQHHIEYGGFTFANLKLLSKGNIQQAISSENSHRVGNGEFIVHSFIKQLAGDKWCQDYMKMARKFFNESAKDAVNEATIALKHRIVARDSNYIPFEVDKNFVVSEITEESIQQTISSYGMLKDVNKQSAQPLIMTGLDNVIDRHIEQVGNIYGLAVPIRNFNKVWNVHSHTETLGGSGSVKDAVEAAWGKSGTKVITQTVRDLQGSRTVDNPDVYNAYSTIKGNVIGATFKLNLSVVTKQIGSLFTATSMLDWRNPASMLINLLDTMKNHDTISAEVDKYTATAWMRRQGLSDAELHTLATEGQKSKLKRWSNKLPTAISPDKWITGMDSMVALSLWKYAKEDVAKRTNLKGEALLKETAKFYDELVENTQSMSDVLHRPEVQRSKNILLETLSMFKTDLYQMAGQLQGAYGRYQANNSEENGKALAKTVGSVLMSTMWGALMTTLWALVRYKVNPYRDDEDDELTIESWLSRQGVAVVADLVGYVVPLFGSEAVGIIERIWTGETEDVADSLVLSAVNDVVSAIEGVANSAVEGEFPKEEAFKGLLTKVCSLFGVPMSNILRIIEAIKLHGEDIANKEFLSFEAGLTRPNSTRLYNAYIERDPVKIERASRLYEDQKEIESALRKAIRDNDPRLEEAALARLNGDRDTYYRLMMDVIDEGNFDKQIIKDAFDAEYNYQKKKAEENK